MTDIHAEAVPPYWWKFACETVHHPIACVALDNKFIWVNSAFERMLGYSVAEITKLTWMEVTLDHDVGGNLESISSVRKGDTSCFTMTKRYRHKLGHSVPVTVSVWKFPPGFGDTVCFLKDSAPMVATLTQLEELRNMFDDHIRQQGRKGHDPMITIGDTNANNNDHTPLIWAAVAIFSVLTTALLYLVYYIVAKGSQAPTSIPGLLP